jgi:chromosome segregation ATPase
MKAKSKLIAGAILVLLLFVGGVAAGYYMWGLKDDEAVDYKRFLKDTAKYIASLEQKNSELEKQMGAGDTSLKSTDEEKPSGAVKSSGEDGTLQQKIKSLEEEKAALQVAMSSDMDLTRKNRELIDQVQSLIQAKNVVEQENTELRSKIGADQDLTAENQSLTEQIQALTAEKAELEQKITELQSDISQNQHFVEANQKLEKQIQACIESKAGLEKENTELQSLQSNNQVLIVENQTLRETIESHVNEINVLKTRLTEIRSMTQVQEEAEAQTTDSKPEATP